MVVDGSTKKFGLLVGKGDRNGLGFDFSGPAPVALWALAQTALSHPKRQDDLGSCSIQYGLWAKSKSECISGRSVGIVPPDSMAIRWLDENIGKNIGRIKIAP